MLRRIQRRMQVIGASDGMKYVELLRDKGAGDTIRIWTAGCSSGEEPYSIAILLAEALARLRARPTIQIFATDIDEQMLQQARAASYRHSAVRRYRRNCWTAIFSPTRITMSLCRTSGIWCGSPVTT
jgi:chemotaxis methyl-accepting protein methylase